MKYLLSILLFCSALNHFASVIPITGLVVDAETKNPLPFTNIVVEGKNKGTVSNIEGHFVLDGDNLDPKDMVIFSYVGYETFRIRLIELKNQMTIYLHQTTVKIGDVNVSSKSLSAEEILVQVRKNYKKNYPNLTQKQTVFLHKLEKTPFPETNQIILKNSNFVGLDRKTFDEVMRSIPREFVDYQESIIELYNQNDDYKMVPTKGISLEEGANQALFEEMETKLGDLFDDIQLSNKDKKIYYQFRSGILRHKIKNKNNNQSVLEESRNDKLHNPVKTKEVKNGILLLLNNYTRLKSKNWEFVDNPGRYYYTKEYLTVFNDDMVYAISFKPKRNGLFEGTIYISTSTYAVLQLDFAFAAGKQSERFHAFGFGHSMNFVKGRVIFEKGNKGYFLKYISAQQHELASIDRNFSIKKKQKRFLADKELNEIKLVAKISFNMKSNWELLVLEREEISVNQFEKVKEPVITKFKKEYAYNPEMWNNRTVIAPDAELKKYKRKE